MRLTARHLLTRVNWLFAAHKNPDSRAKAIDTAIKNAVTVQIDRLAEQRDYVLMYSLTSGQSIQKHSRDY